MRLGIMCGWDRLLGVVPAGDMDRKPVVHFETAIASLHRIPPSEGVGHGLEDAANMNASSPPCPLAMRTDTREASPMDAGRGGSRQTCARCRKGVHGHDHG